MIRSSVSTCMTPKPVASMRGTSMQPTVTSASRSSCMLQHRLVVHLVDMVAGQDDDVVRAVALDDVDVLVHRIGGAGVPLVLRDALAGGQDVEALVAFDAEEVPAALQMADQAVRLVLRRDADAADAGVQRIGQCEIDDARLAAEIHRRLGTPVGQFHQPAAAPARQHIGHCRPGDRSAFRNCQHGVAPRQVSASSVRMRSRAAVSPSSCTGWIQTCVAPACEMRAQALLHLVGVAPQHHRVDEPVGAAVRQLRLGEADAQPVVAVIVEHHVARQLLAPERARLRRIGFQRNLLLGHQPLVGSEDPCRLRRVLRRRVVRQRAAGRGWPDSFSISGPSAAMAIGQFSAPASPLVMPSR